MIVLSMIFRSLDLMSKTSVNNGSQKVHGTYQRGSDYAIRQRLPSTGVISEPISGHHHSSPTFNKKDFRLQIARFPGPVQFRLGQKAPEFAMH